MGQDASLPLTSAKRERFCQEYRQDSNATQAAIRAGYSAKTAGSQGQRLLKNVAITARLDWLTAQDAAASELNARWVLDRLKEVAERCMEATHVRDRSGKIVDGEWTFDSGGANRSLELLGKHLRMWVDRAEVTGVNGEPLIPPGRLAPDEIKSRLAAMLGARN